MHGLMILCLAAFAVAAPEGYNYEQSSNQFLSSGSGSGSGSGILSSGGGSGFSYSGGAQGYEQQQPVISKHFYIHSAPEEHDAQVINKEIYVGTPRKNVNVVFVKSAATSAHRTNLRVIPAVNEEKTVVYVLAKNGAENEVLTQVAETASHSHKPEVHFIKYNTNEEAEHAQRSIQSQYDSLGGSSNVINEGVGHVTSVIGSLGGQDAAYGGSSGSGLTTIAGGHGFGAGSGIASTSFGPGNGFEVGNGAGATGHGIGSGGDSAGGAYLPPVKKQ